MNLEEVFRLILVTSAMGTIVALLILFVKSVLGRHINAHWSYLIWFVLLVRLVFPVIVNENSPFMAEKLPHPVT